jgi:AraC family transcriptional regulator
MFDTEFRSEIVFVGSSIKIGSFFCPSTSTLWQTENIAASCPMLVFPRTNVRIIQADRKPVVASPNCVMFYNTDQFYHREQIGGQSDRCEYFHIPPETIVDVFRSLGIQAPEDMQSPFQFASAPCSPNLYLLQRCLYNYLHRRDQNEALNLEETFLFVLEDEIRRAAQFHQLFRTGRQTTLDSQIQLVEAAKAYIGVHFRQSIQLENLSSAVGVSVFHLCRIFRKLTGLTIHAFVLQLRLRSTLQEVIDKKNPSLTDVALDYGFSSHSHFTNSFRNLFGVSPSRLRAKNQDRIDPERISSLFTSPYFTAEGN